MMEERESMGKSIPDGYVLVNKAPGVAAGLLEAADKLGADRKWDVRSISGGYIVRADVAEAWQGTLPADDEVDTGGEADGDASGTTPDAPKPDETWTVAQIDEWAENQDPPITFEAGAKKADKLAVIHG